MVRIVELISLALLLPLLVLAAPAQAHKLKAFASAEGSSISGYAYFSPGGRLHHGAVTVTAPDGRVIAQMPTDDEGNFRFEATQRIDYQIMVDGEDGHRASTLVPASELPENLPAGGTAAASSPAPVSVPDLKLPPPGGQATADLVAVIERSVARQVRPLREQLDAYQEKLWLHDVLGGLGMIFGLGGVAFGLSSRRRNPPAPGTKP